MQKQTKKQKLYLAEVIRLHCEYGYGEDRISRILPISHTTVSRWIAIFKAEKNKQVIPLKKKSTKVEAQAGAAKVQALEAEIARLRSQLKGEKLRADAYDEMINIAESKFKIAIRKKAGAKR